MTSIFSNLVITNVVESYTERALEETVNAPDEPKPVPEGTSTRVVISIYAHFPPHC